ncbi:MAG: CehA/McbA family metallohydrolase [Acidobacteria bacterium]|nr:CehA/McbA family metallohydrolase [Acidobacteriota bacterium]
MKRTFLAVLFAGLLSLAQFPTREPYPGHARVRIEIRDQDGRPTGVRLRVTNASGEYFAPLGHLPQPDPARRMSGDLILGDGDASPLELHAYLYDGHAIDLPAGRYIFEARKGFEYAPLNKAVAIAPAAGQVVRLEIRKFEDFEAKGWYPGDTHMHFPDPAGIRYEMECEGLRVCSLLLLKSGYRSGRPGDGHFQNVEHFRGRQLLSVSGGRHFIKTGEEFRHGLLAHMIFQNLESIVWPVSVGGLREGGAGGYDWPWMLHATADARAQGALVTWAHWPYPTYEAPLDIALGRIDSIDLLTTGSPFEHHPVLVDIYKLRGPKVYSIPPIDVYYHYLNCGFRLAASSGSDKMALNPPMGSARTYVRTDGPLSYDAWIEGIRNGHTFVSTYPLLDFSVNGKGPGETIRFGEKPAEVKVSARAVSIEPYDVLEVLHNGKVIARAKPGGGHHTAAFQGTLTLDRGGWIAARAYGSRMLEYGATWWKQPVFAHTSPVYLEADGRPAPAAESAKLFLEQLDFLERWADRQAHFPSVEAKAEAMKYIAQARGIYQKLLHLE